MKHYKILLVAAFVLISALYILPVLAVPALAEGQITLSTNQSSVGQTVSISGTAFYGTNATQTEPRGVNILFVKSNPNTSLGTIDYTNAVYENVSAGGAVELRNGEFRTNFTVPSKLTGGITDEDVVKGTYSIYVTYYHPTAPPDGKNNPYILVSQTFTVTSGNINIAPAGGTVGSQISVNGTSFGASEGLTIKFDNVDIDSGGAKTDAGGAFPSLKITVPPSAAGQHTVTVSGNTTTIKATATFALLPDIVLTPPSGASGGVLAVKGSGFAGGTDVTTTFDNVTSVSATTDALGGFTASLVIPVRGPGNYNVKSLDNSGNSDVATFSVVAGTISLSQASGIARSALSISGDGLLPSHAITVTFGTTKVATANSDAQGNYNANFVVPELAAGSYEVKATDSINTTKINFTITAAAPSPEPTPTPTTPSPTTPTPVPPAPAADVTPPAIPAPLKPEMGLKASPRTFFKWLEVTDPSRVTYSLQVATDSEFLASAVVIDKTEINDTKYTLTRQEELAPPEKDTIYYWRIKAVDGKGNESPWSGTGEFTVGSRFNLTQPQIYLGIGIGALALVIFAFWLGRRTSYY